MLIVVPSGLNPIVRGPHGISWENCEKAGKTSNLQAGKRPISTFVVRLTLTPRLSASRFTLHPHENLARCEFRASTRLSGTSQDATTDLEKCGCCYASH